MSNNESPFAANTQRILDEGIECGNDFVSLCISGESLRGHASMNETSPPELATYDAFLATYTGEAWDDLEVTMADIMVELVRYANEPHITRDWETGTGLLDDINDTLALASAMVRAGRWEVSRLKAMSDRARQVVDFLVPSLMDLCQYADDHQMIYMMDGDFCVEDIHDVYSFWSPLAYFSESRMALQASIRAWARKERILQLAMRAFEAKHSQ